MQFGSSLYTDLLPFHLFQEAKNGEKRDDNSL